MLTAQTLTFPFPGSDRQKWNTLEFVVSRPKFFHPNSSLPVLDENAIKASLFYGDKLLVDTPTLSWEYTITVSWEYVSVQANTLKKGESITLNSDSYNDKKTTSYRLPRDMRIEWSDIPRDVSFAPVGESRDRTYDISLYGLEEYTPENIEYFVHYESWRNCTLKDSWQYLVPLRANQVHPLTREGQISHLTVQLDYDVMKPRLCIIAWVNGVYRTLEDRTLEDFSATGSTLEMLSPELDMRSQIEFRFSQSIYTDSGMLYSPEYIAHRHDAKIEFLKHLNISPDIKLGPDNLTLSPDRAIITAPLEEGKHYTFSLNDLEDVYGRKLSVSHEITPKREPFLSLKLENGKNIFQKWATIPARLFSLEPKKKSYSLKLCQLKLDPYARMERLMLDTNITNSDEIYRVLSDSENAYNCVKKDIVLSSSGYVSPFDLRDIAGKRDLTTGLYMLYFSDRTDVVTFPKVIRPLLFSIVDTHVTMKVDASGKMMFLVTDLSTGKPLADQEITVMRNVSNTHINKWNSVTQKVDVEYLPLTAQSFATGVVIWKTNADWFLETKIDSLKGSDNYDASPYNLSFESWWEYEGRYDSFLVQAKNGERLGYLVSTWNDGITGYNFGMKDSDYSYASRSKYTSYLHPDRKLYLPGEKVYIHAIIRENSTSLQIPKDKNFDLVISDPMGKEMKRVTMKPNEFGALATDFMLPKDAPLGSYMMNLTSSDNSEYVENGYSNFQVEVFKNPTFTASIDLKSGDIEDNYIKALRKKENTDTNNPWYKDVYTGNFTMEGIIHAKYYNGTEMKNTPFSYRVYRSVYYPEDYFSNCFWWCYYEPPIEYYTEWTGMIDGDGYGIVRIPVEYSSFYDDYKYTTEVVIRDPLSGEEVTTPGTLVVKLPTAYKSFSLQNPLIFTPKKKILSYSENFIWTIAPEYGKWDASLSGKYHYEIIHREYKEWFVDDIRAWSVRITTPVDHVMMSGSITNENFSQKLIAFPPGEYHMKIVPYGTDNPPESSISDAIFYITGDMTSSRDNNIHVLTERTVYKMGEMAKVLIQVPFTGSYLLITREKWGVISHEYTYLSGNTLTREFLVDDTMVPNAYIGVVALRPSSTGSTYRTYAVWYTEVVVDISDKKSILTLSPDKTTYKNRENVSLDMTLTDKSGNPLEWEVTVMVVDESLIRLLWNIDLDIVPKFFQKFPFTIKTSLSAIGIERNRFLSRKGSNGWSGDKWGWWIEIASRTIFKNTAYYNPGIRTDVSGKAHLSFSLPDNVTDYRIIAIANTQDSRFGVSEKTIEVRKDYVLEAHAPMILRSGDTFTFTTSAFNSTKRITSANVILKMGTWSNLILKKADVILSPSEGKSVDFTLKVPSDWKTQVPYTVELREKDTLLDSISSSIRIPEIPIIENTSHGIQVWTWKTLSVNLPKMLSGSDSKNSRVEINLSLSYASEMDTAIRSLLQYPYGCIEQTISSTLPNALALSFADSIGTSIDKEKAKIYLDAGLKKILRMQHPSGGWVYWEWDDSPNAHITPYVLRSLKAFRDLGQDIPEEVFANGVNSIINNPSEYTNDENLSAEVAWTLSLLKDARALDWWKKIDPNKLDRHGFLAYAYSAKLLDILTPQITRNLETKMNTVGDYDYWYWSRSADQAIYAGLLLEQDKTDAALKIIDSLARHIDMWGYYSSTQEKLQFFLVLAQDARLHAKKIKSMPIALRGDSIITDGFLSPSQLFMKVLSTREKMGNSFSLKRDSGEIPVYITTNVKDIPKDISLMSAYSTGGIQVTRSFARIDESRWVDEHGNFLIAEPVTNGIFEKWKLYRVTLDVHLSNFTKNQSWFNLSMEDYFPAGWRPIRGIFKTESALTQEGSDGGWWDHIESQDDRLLVNMSYGYGNTRKYVYYIRPDYVWEYLLPPATGYFMYRPEVHSYTRYEHIQVQ